MSIMYKQIYLNFGVISFINKEMVTFIQLHTYKFGLVYLTNANAQKRFDKQTNLRYTLTEAKSSTDELSHKSIIYDHMRITHC